MSNAFFGSSLNTESKKIKSKELFSVIDIDYVMSDSSVGGLFLIEYSSC